MDHDRRTFLKTTSLVAADGGERSLPRRRRKPLRKPPQRGRAERAAEGHDVRHAAAAGRPRSWPSHRPRHPRRRRRRAGFPRGRADHHRRGVHGPGRYRRRSSGSPTRRRASASADRYFVAVDKAAFGPCVTNPEKIICIGLNYRKHIAEMAMRRCPRCRCCSASTTPRSTTTAAPSRVSEDGRRRSSTTKPSW